MNIANWLYATALHSPKAPALFSGTDLIEDYYGFAIKAASYANYLQEQYAVKKGDKIALFLPNRVEYLIVQYAAWWLGAVIVPINYKLHTKEAAWIIENSGASIVFTDAADIFDDTSLPADCCELSIDQHVIPQLSKHKLTVLQEPLAVDSKNLAWLFYTSGTTGRPKGVMLSHSNLVAMSLCYPMDVDTVSPDDAALYAAPMSHGAGLYNMIFVRIGARHVVPKSRRFDSSEIFAVAKELKNITMFAAPTMLKRMVAQAKQESYDGTGIKTISLGGGPLYAADLIEALGVMGNRFVQIYGQGESPMTITAMPKSLIQNKDNPNWEHWLGSVGIAQSCIEIKIVDEKLEKLPANECGEVLVRGDAVMQGYWQNPEATAKALVDGWLRTGDIGYLSDDGFLTLTDRSKDVIITGGSNVYPREVEEVLASHQDVYEVAVVGGPNQDWGEEVVAFVVTKADKNINEQQLEQWCRDNMASFKKPKRYIFTDNLPKNSYGKVLKTELRKQLGNTVM